MLNETLILTATISAWYFTPCYREFIMRFKTKCVDAYFQEDDNGINKHVLVMSVDPDNIGMFGSRIKDEQFEKAESVFTKRYIKLPFGIRILL